MFFFEVKMDLINYVLKKGSDQQVYDPSITGLERKIRTAETSYQFKDANELFNCIKNLRPKRFISHETFLVMLKRVLQLGK